jgi:hypothetical protein
MTNKIEKMKMNVSKHTDAVVFIAGAMAGGIGTATAVLFLVWVL